MTTKDNITYEVQYGTETEERIEWKKQNAKCKEALAKLEESAREMRDNIRKAIEKQMENLKQTDNVNHPSHYCDGKIEVIDFIEDKKLGYHLGNVVKYVSRAGKKCPDKEIEDLKKARWYLNRYIEKLEATNEKEV